MRPEKFLYDLIAESRPANSRNIDFLKKYLLTFKYGSLRVNGLSPDDKFTSGQYLLDDERVMIDYTRLDSQHKKLFQKWFLDNHHKDVKDVFQNDYKITDYRGFSAEVKLNWWGRFLNSWFFKRKYKKIILSPLELSLNYQLNSIELSHGDNGILVGFNHFGTQNTQGKYHSDSDEQENPLRNTKRLFLTNKIVDQLVNMPLKKVTIPSYEKLINSPHPMSVTVTDEEKRMLDMREYRISHGYLKKKNLLTRIFNFVVSLFKKSSTPRLKIQQDNKFFDLPIDIDGINVRMSAKTSELIVTEPRPPINTFVFCGGGAKIFGHIGAMRAFYASGIRPKKFAGSSAGAIMALLGYLGYEPDEIQDYFQNFNQEVLIKKNIDRRGYSAPNALNSAINAMIVKRFALIKGELNQIKPDGYNFLTENYYKRDNKITFSLIKKVKDKFPDLARKFNLGDDLIVTATNMQSQKTDFFSYETTPNVELGQAVTASACFPILYKPFIINGIPYKDGGLLNNFPIDIFKDDDTTFLESKYGIDFKVVGFQFDNGVERTLLDKFQQKIYRENSLYNKLIGFITGVEDPVSGWQKDRIKLLKYSGSVIIIPCDNVSATNFAIPKEVRDALLSKGKEVVQDYLVQRYCVEKFGDDNNPSHRIALDKDGCAKNGELIFHKFDNMQELLAYCYYRNSRGIFDKLENFIQKNHLFRDRDILLLKAEKLKKLFDERSLMTQKMPKQELSKYLEVNNKKNDTANIRNNSLFKSLHSLFVESLDKLFFHKDCRKQFETTRFNISLNNPSGSIADLKKCFKSQGDKKHLLVYMLDKICQQYHGEDERLFEKEVQKINALLRHSGIRKQLYDERLFDNWEMSLSQCYTFLNDLKLHSLSYFTIRRGKAIKKGRRASFPSYFNTQESQTLPLDSKTIAMTL